MDNANNAHMLEVENIVKRFGAHEVLKGVSLSARPGDVISIMQTYFGAEKYSIWSLFKEEKRKILDSIARQGMEDIESSLRRTYNRDYPLVNALANNDIPIPKAYKTTFEYPISRR